MATKPLDTAYMVKTGTTIDPDSGEALVELMLYPRPAPGDTFDVRRLIPSFNPDPNDRARAWQDSWEQISNSVLRFIRCKNGTSTDDNDLLADALATAYFEVECGRYEYRPLVPFVAYVKGIARNMIREAYRRDKRLTPLDDTPLYAETYDDQADVERHLEQWEQRQILYKRLLELPPRRRQVLLLTSEGHDTSQIARNLGIREDLVRQEKCRGLQELRRKMA